MNEGEIVNTIRERGGFDTKEHAEQASLATLSVLAERLDGGEPADLASQLPGRLGEAAASEGPGEVFGLDEFARRVAEREDSGCSPEQARRHMEAVLATVAEAVSEGEVIDVRAQLPDDVRQLLPA